MVEEDIRRTPTMIVVLRIPAPVSSNTSGGTRASCPMIWNTSKVPPISRLYSTCDKITQKGRLRFPEESTRLPI